ncbi:hypothetical protein [Paenibacillus sp. V4I7]|nr:hypothetical protein [Paenibacillus sp. V4I7]MDQ0898441.1 hypothetical protein [Paenibacillus sp. V4I7]
MNPIIAGLWSDYRQAVKAYGHGKETKQILIKIYEIQNSLAPTG